MGRTVFTGGIIEKERRLSMAVIRKVYSTGGATVVALSKIQSEMTGLVVGSEAMVELCTPTRLLKSMGVADGG